MLWKTYQHHIQFAIWNIMVLLIALILFTKRVAKTKFSEYKPQPVKLVDIPKPNGKTRPLGIPTIWDRIIQQCLLQVLEPIMEAKFHDKNYGFRPNRSAHHAFAQAVRMAQLSKLTFVVDIEGFFDNVNHSKLIKQFWTLGVRDKWLLGVIRAMLKAPIIHRDGRIEHPKKGTPQGGVLSPLLADEKGTLVELKGQGCREFECLLVAQNRSWFDFFNTCEKEKVHYKRIDLAINDRNGRLSIPYLAEKCSKKELRSKFRSFRSIDSGRLEDEEEAASTLGTTLYLGSLKSDFYFCFYQNNYEQLVKNRIALEDSTIKNRYEIRLKDDRAYYAIQDLLTHQDFEQTVFNIINTYIVFLTPIKKQSKRKWPVDRTWKLFLGN